MEENAFIIWFRQISSFKVIEEAVWANYLYPFLIAFILYTNYNFIQGFGATNIHKRFIVNIILYAGKIWDGNIRKKTILFDTFCSQYKQ